MDIKNLIANCVNYENFNAYDLLLESSSPDKGDYCLPCFTLSKILHDNPNNIANKINATIKPNKFIEKTEVVGGYVNFFLNKQVVAENILSKFSEQDLKLTVGNNQTVCIDYCSPNLAKYLHIGHLKTTIIGESLARIFEQCGYNVKRLNFVGDYGTPFGMMIYGILNWGSLEDVKTRGNEALQEYYVRFNKEAAEDENLQQAARDIFQKIEQKDKDIYPIYKLILEIALADAKNMFNTLGVHFDDYRGEMYYNQFVPQAIKLLKDKKLLTLSEDAQIVDLSAYDMSPAVILKKDGTTLYITRDISAIISRYNEYKFDKMLYVTDVAQSLHFKQLIKIIELLGYNYYSGTEHVPYGRFSLPDGKISSRRGKQAVLVDLIEYIKQKAETVIENRNFTIENPADVASKVARAVLNFSVLKVERTKDCVFDIEKAFSFDGETAPYMQYTYTRLESILRKFENNNAEADYSCFDSVAFSLVKMINNFSNTILTALDKRDPSILANRLMDLCKTFNKFYVNTKVLDGNPNTTKAKIELVKALKDTLKVGFNLICIDTLKEM